jgi:BON domain
MRIRNLALAGLAGAAMAYYFHPVEGIARRRRLRGQIERLISGRLTLRTDQQPMPENVAPAAAPPVVRPSETGALPEDQPDAIIAERVRQRLQERPELETSNLMIDVVRGVAYLRGDLHDRARFDDIVDVTGSVPGVRRVQSLLHIPESETISRPTTRHLGDAWNG